MLNSINNFGMVLFAAGKVDEAERFVREALEQRQRVLGEDHDRARETARDLADLRAAWDRVEPGTGHDAASHDWRAKGGG